MIRALTVFLAAAYGAIAQSDAGLDLWVRVRAHVRAAAAGLPNYSCQETMDRSIQGRTGQIEFRERLRLDVLFTDTTEMFAWPGSSEFTSEQLENWIGAGAIGNGDFATELLNLFVVSAATVKYEALETRDQHALHRFDFHMPLFNSRYTVAVGGRSATLAYSGSFWVDPESLDIIRLETRAEEIPSYLACSEVRHSVTYGRPGAGERVLPSAAELTIISRDGHLSRNTIVFSGCRQYTASSSLLFTPAPDIVEATKPKSQKAIPAGVELALRLERPIAIRESAAGDPIVARLDSAVSSGGIMLPKGTRVLGRVRRLEQHLSSTPWTLVGLQFFGAEAPDGLVLFGARLVGPRSTPDVIRMVNNRWEIQPGKAGLHIEDGGATTGVGLFRLPGRAPQVERGLRMLWKTQ